MKMSISDVCNNHTQTRVLVENRVQLRDKDSGDLSVEEAGVVTSVADHWRFIYENIPFYKTKISDFECVCNQQTEENEMTKENIYISSVVLF